MSDLFSRIINRDFSALARAITVVENKSLGYQELLNSLYSHRKKSHKIGITGPPGAGKSTITSTLTRGKLDNGNGLARTACFRFKHEIDSGRTSSNSVDNFISFELYPI